MCYIQGSARERKTENRPGFGNVENASDFNSEFWGLVEVWGDEEIGQREVFAENWPLKERNGVVTRDGGKSMWGNYYTMFIVGQLG